MPIPIRSTVQPPDAHWSIHHCYQPSRCSMSTGRRTRLGIAIALIALALFPLNTQAQWTTLGTSIYNTLGGDVGIGTAGAAPQADVHVYKPTRTDLWLQAYPDIHDPTPLEARIIFRLGAMAPPPLEPAKIQAMEYPAASGRGLLEFYTNSSATPTLAWLSTMSMTEGRVGMNTVPNAETQLHIKDRGGLLVEGIVGNIPVTGAGSRMMFIPSLSAFRAGYVVADEWDVIGGASAALGHGTVASGDYSFAMGFSDTASDFGSVAMGVDTKASGYTSVAMGWTNKATGSSSLALGELSTASGDNSTAMGFGANTNNHSGSFNYGHPGGPNLANTQDNQFMATAFGGTVFLSGYSSGYSGVYLVPGAGAWSTISDRRMKENVRDENAEVILRKVIDLPVTSWNYKTQADSFRHIGPMAQDFHAAFGFGESDTMITTTDIEGVTLIALKGLAQRTAKLTSQVDSQTGQLARIDQLQRENTELRLRLERIEQILRDANLGGTTPPKIGALEQPLQQKGGDTTLSSR